MTDLDGLTGIPTQWAGLSRFLIARICPCSSKGVEVTDATSVFGPVSDVNFELSLNWQSPFENSGPESKLPSLMAMVQSGQIEVVANTLQSFGIGTEKGSTSNTLIEGAKTASSKLEGKTGITKLNSRQVFSGMPPAKISLTLHCRAHSDPQTEVVVPYRRLLSWALPQKLAADGALASLAAADRNIEGFIGAMFPSDAPQMVSFQYKNQRFAPMVIEHLSHPMDGPCDAYGLPLSLSVQLQLSTLTALDKADVATLFR